MHHIKCSFVKHLGEQLHRAPQKIPTPFCSGAFKSSQISFIAWKIRKIMEASADTAATETYYMKGYYNLEEEKIKVKI